MYAKRQRFGFERCLEVPIATDVQLSRLFNQLDISRVCLQQR